MKKSFMKNLIFFVIFSICLTMLVGCINANFLSNDPYKKSKLLGYYIKKKDYKAIEKMLKTDINVNLPTSDPKYYSEADESPYQVTPLLIACSEGDLRSVKLLLENGATTSVIKNTQWSPLHETLWKYNSDDYEIVKLLIENGADVNLYVSGFNPILLAASLGIRGKNVKYDEVVANDILRIFKLLESSGADINVNFSGNVLINASYFGNLPLVKYLIEEKGFDVNMVDTAGRTALWDSASVDRNSNVVKYLISRGADKSYIKDGKNALDIAKENGCKENVRILSQN